MTEKKGECGGACSKSGKPCDKGDDCCQNKKETKKDEDWIKPIEDKTGHEPGGACDVTKGPCSCGAWH